MVNIKLTLKDPSKETPEIRAWLDECARLIERNMNEVDVAQFIAFGETINVQSSKP